MSPIFENHLIIDQSEKDTYIDKFDVLEIKDLDNNKLLISYKDKIDDSKSLGYLENDSKNVSVSIASAITAYARIRMSDFKNNPNYTLFFFDTDSLMVDKPLDPEYIGTKLGELKLENVFVKFAALAPKVYGGITKDGKVVTKVKGFRNKVSFEDLESLLNKNKSLKLSHEKWFKNIEAGNIIIKDQLYNLKVTDNKRELIYDENGLLIGTKPFVIDEEIEDSEYESKSDS